MKTRITELLEIEYPVLQGGMAWVSDAKLAAAVSNAGGLGIISAGNAPYDYVKEQIQNAKKWTKKPFGVNIMLMSPYIEEIAKLVAEEKVSVVTTGAGSPQKFIPLWKEAGIKVVPVVPSKALALRMENSGADAVIAEGCESGGHIGELTTMTLVPQVVDTVKIPVIAAGGIADSRGTKAAFCLGAEGVQCGTVFLASDECNVHENYKEAVIKATDTSTAVTGRTTGLPVRCLKNKMTRELLAAEKSGVGAEELEEKTVGSLRRAVKEGDKDYGSMMSGQIAGLVREVLPCKTILQKLTDGVEEFLKCVKKPQ